MFGSLGLAPPVPSWVLKEAIRATVTGAQSKVYTQVQIAKLDNLEFILLETVPALERPTERGEFDSLWSMPVRLEVWLE
jgi:hypothetical protein